MTIFSFSAYDKEGVKGKISQNMNASPENEGSVLSILRAIIRREMVARGNPMLSPRRIETQDKQEKRKRAELIVEELERISTKHKSADLLLGLRPDPDSLAKHDRLAEFFVDILRVSDPNKYHDPDWLKGKHDALDLILKSDPTISETSDRGVYDKLLLNFNYQLTKAENYKRRDIIGRDEKTREWMSQEAYEAERRREEVGGGRKATEKIVPTAEEMASGYQLLSELPESLISKELLKVAENIDQGEYVDPQNRINFIDRFQQGYSDARIQLVKKLSKTAGSEKMKDEHEEASGQYEKLTRAWEKMAHQIVEKLGGGGGRDRLTEFLRSTQGEAIVEMIQTDENYRDYWFYHILEPILFNQQGAGHQELYNLWVAGDMDIFMDIVRGIKQGLHGERTGLKYAARYEILKNTIFQSHDMDYFAAHPAQDMKEFISSTGLFVNKYIDAAHQDPLVSLSKRAYEMALLAIKDTNRGWIPREWLAWEEGSYTPSKLDETARDYLMEMIEMGQLYHVKTDDVTGLGLPSPSVWNRKQTDPSRPFTKNELYGYESRLSDKYRNNLGDLKIAAALKQAKGLALVDQRLLEIIAHSKGTGSEYDQAGEPGESFSLSARQFNSIPYEGIVRYINPIIHYYSRYRLGGEYYDAFFNMLVLKQWKNWNPEIMKKVVEFHVKGDHEGMIEYLESEGIKDAAQALKSRLIENENPFEYSGMWGPWTSWRLGDAALSFDDWERNRAYGTNIKLLLAKDYATRQARRHFEEHSEEFRRYRTEFRDHLKNSNELRWREAAIRDEAIQRSNSGDIYNIDGEFELLWREMGKTYRPKDSKKTYRDLIDDLWVKNKDAYEERVEKLKKAYLARTWVQASMRSPLLVARFVETEWVNRAGYKVETKLRNKIISEILGKDIDETAQQRTPTTTHREVFDQVARLEATVAAISQRAIRENKDLKEEYFDQQIKLVEEDKSITEVVREDKLKNLENAKRYWEKVKKAMLGDFKTADQWYRELGIEDAGEAGARGSRMDKINWNQVEKIVETEKDKDKKLKKDSLENIITKLKIQSEHLTDKLCDRNYKTVLFSTEDMGWEFLNIEALGERNPVRRAGDLASHVQFAQLFEEYINNLLVARPKIDDLVKKQKEMWTALSGDFIDIANRSCYRIAYTTAMMYRASDISWAIPFFSPVYGVFHDNSIMQMIRGKDRADAWGPNELLHYVQAVGGQQILQKRDYSGLEGYAKLDKLGYGPKMGPSHKGYTSANLGMAVGGTKFASVWEIASLSLMATTILNIVRSFRAKNEEDEEK